jgi:hydroxymethylbilane synthase
LSQPLKVGTRGSRLAVAQAEQVAASLGGAEVVTVEATDGQPGDKERFVRGIDRALLDGRVDLGVHSAKDLPADRPEAIRLVGVVGREDPADAYLGAGSSPAELVAGARVGTASLRRRSQLLALRPDLEPVELHGNVDTRLRKLDQGGYEGIVLAVAGLRRLGREGEIAFRFGLQELTPAGGQGSLALEARRDDPRAAAEAARISSHDALVELTAERAALVALEASCETPVGVCARLGERGLEMFGYAGRADGSDWVRDLLNGDPEQPAALGEALAERMLAAGAREILGAAEPGG